MSVKIFLGTQSEIEHQLEDWHQHIERYLGWCRSYKKNTFALIVRLHCGISVSTPLTHKMPTQIDASRPKAEYVTDPLAG